MRRRMDSEGPIPLRAEKGSELMLDENLQRTRVRAGGNSVAKSTVINSPSHFSLFGTLERYFPFQMQLEIRLVKSRSETSSPLPLKTRSLCQGVEEKWPRSPAKVEAAGRRRGINRGAAWGSFYKGLRIRWLMLWIRQVKAHVSSVFVFNFKNVSIYF